MELHKVLEGLRMHQGLCTHSYKHRCTFQFPPYIYWQCFTKPPGTSRSFAKTWSLINFLGLCTYICTLVSSLQTWVEVFHKVIKTFFVMNYMRCLICKENASLWTPLGWQPNSIFFLFKNSMECSDMPHDTCNGTCIEG